MMNFEQERVVIAAVGRLIRNINACERQIKVLKDWFAHGPIGDDRFTSETTGISYSIEQARRLYGIYNDSIHNDAKNIERLLEDTIYATTIKDGEWCLFNRVTMEVMRF